MIDLHSHSTASDGSLSPAELVALAAKSGVTTLALTDHDTLAGIPEAEEAAGKLGVRLIRGVEIEIVFSPGEFHVLGLDLRDIDGEIGEAMTRLARLRRERNGRIIAKLNAAGIDATMEELIAIATGSGEEFTGQIGRPHIASLLVARKAAKDRQDAFDKWLAKGRPFYDAKECLELGQAIQLIHDAGGLAIVAHPRSLFISWGRLSTHFDEWKDLAIDGIEAWHPTAKAGECRRLEKMGRDRSFRITAGSDYHGSLRPERRLGHTAGKIAIGEEWLKEIERPG